MFDEEKIVANRIRTPDGTILESKHRHDFVSCSCESIFIDGGTDYIRAGGRPEDFISLLELSE